MKYKITNKSLIMIILTLTLLPLFGNENLLNNSITTLLGYILPVITVVFLGIDLLKSKSKFKINIQFILYILFLISLAISLIFSISYKVYTISNLLKFIIFPLLSFLISSIDFSESDNKKLAFSIITITMVISAFAIIQYIFGFQLSPNGIEKYIGAKGRASSTLYISTLLDKFLVLNIIIFFYFKVKSASESINKLLTFCILILSIALAVTFSRTGIIILIISYVILLIYFIKNKLKKYILDIVLSIILIISIPGQIYLFNSIFIYVGQTLTTVCEKTNTKIISDTYDKFLNFIMIDYEHVYDGKNKDEDIDDQLTNKNDYSIGSRKYFRNVAYNIMISNPVHGIGIGSYNFVYDNQNANKYINHKFDTTSKYLYPHNMYLQLGSEIGIIGLVIFIILYFGSVLYTAIKNKSLFLGLILIFLILSCWTESIFYMKDICYYVIIIVALVMNNTFMQNRNTLNSNNKKVLFISSTGGHLNELMQLKSLFKKYDYSLITEKTKSNLSLKDKYNDVHFLVYGTKDHKLSYIFKFLYNCIKSIILYIKIRPKVIVTTGTHTAVPICYIGKFFGTKIIFIETFANSETKTLSGKLIYPIADTFIVQWESMLKLYPKAIYGGWIY